MVEIKIMKFKKIFILILILLMSISAVNAHGVDVTDNHMVIADDTNGANAKNLAEKMNAEFDENIHNSSEMFINF